jgi:CRP/FNR family transcriptional regulator, anaerobic regulatory protein
MLLHGRGGGAAYNDPATMAAPVITLHELKSTCSSCSLRELCLPMGLSSEEVEQIDDLVATRRRVRSGASLYRAGDAFGSIYAVRNGFFKSIVPAEDGRDQVTGFHMPGDVLGIDGIGTDSHTLTAVALEDSEVCIIPFPRLEEVSTKVRGLQRQFHRLMSREIVRDQGVMLLLGTMRAEERLAAFLLNLSQRFLALGYSPSDFNLRMTREEIGSFLGIKLETVSRTFSRFQEQRLVEVRQKHIRILDVAGLKRLAGNC